MKICIRAFFHSARPGNIAVVAALTQPFFQINYAATVIVICLVVLVYTDVFQTALLVVSVVAVAAVLF